MGDPLREALETCKRVIESGAEGAIVDTVWISETETLVDRIDAALAAPSGGEPCAWRYRHGSSGWKYVETEADCNPEPGYTREPVYRPPSEPVEPVLDAAGRSEHCPACMSPLEAGANGHFCPECEPEMSRTPAPPEPVAWRVVCADGTPCGHRCARATEHHDEAERMLEDCEETMISCSPHRIEPLGVIS